MFFLCSVYVLVYVLFVFFCVNYLRKALFFMFFLCFFVQTSIKKHKKT